METGGGEKKGEKEEGKRERERDGKRRVETGSQPALWAGWIWDGPGAWGAFWGATTHANHTTLNPPGGPRLGEPAGTLQRLWVGSPAHPAVCSARAPLIGCCESAKLDWLQGRRDEARRTIGGCEGRAAGTSRGLWEGPEDLAPSAPSSAGRIGAASPGGRW